MARRSRARPDSTMNARRLNVWGLAFSPSRSVSTARFRSGGRARSVRASRSSDWRSTVRANRKSSSSTSSSTPSASATENRAWAYPRISSSRRATTSTILPCQLCNVAVDELHLSVLREALADDSLGHADRELCHRRLQLLEDPLALGADLLLGPSHHLPGFIIGLGEHVLAERLGGLARLLDDPVGLAAG